MKYIVGLAATVLEKSNISQNVEEISSFHGCDQEEIWISVLEISSTPRWYFWTLIYSLWVQHPPVPVCVMIESNRFGQQFMYIQIYMYIYII